LLAWLRLATSSSARFGAASPTQLCERFRTSSPRKPGPGATQPKSKVRKILDTTLPRGSALDEARRPRRNRVPFTRAKLPGSAHCLPLGLLPVAPSQAKSGATTIFVNELHAGSFKCPSNDLQRCATRLARPGLQLVHGHNPHPSVLCEFLLAPRKQSASGPALCWRDHVRRHWRNRTIPTIP